ncbi:ABC-2 type transport system permease protein [Abditibacterium utsteinense]|uniref:ABC-2 type transport system permease protein n=1 Tax=Abditibacterium utsteinense TaxID=1960156 RepID=A0A2S8SUA9_9BACT|nr:ABC-2 family transporter protein [Abditibacterium utsteinense]PQV64385.1 ABC-2 type transport system permease protein [Abditibacterium utsteinense]
MRYLRLYRAFLVNCLSRTMEFRAQFFAGILGYGIWTAISLVFIGAVFGNVGAVRGWNKDQMWVLYGTFVVLESLCYGVLGPNMWRFSGQVRDGSLDLALTKPVNVQFFVSARYLDLNGCLNSLVGLALMIVGFSKLGRFPSVLEWMIWLVLLGCGFVMAYAIWFCCVTISIWAVKLEGIAVVFDPMMQMARFPVQIYPARALTFLTIGLPVAFLTTFPTQALLGQTNFSIVVAALALSATFLWISSRFFRFALRFYGSASS